MGIATDAGAQGDALVPYLLQMRKYMPVQHANFVAKLEAGSQVRRVAAASASSRLVVGYNAAVQALHRFRGLHMSLAHDFIRKWDKRNDDEIRGTGGTIFATYLKTHCQACLDYKLPLPAQVPPATEGGAADAPAVN